ncbi:MAG TPA: DUF1593 domain-containing protein [Chryseosolibacter sp.]|nr:DUF1593 domain-containing protein [Chryseosolibacter sp.]
MINIQVLGQNVLRPRLIVLTDISSLSQKEGEPDDGQSLIRLMLYSNDLDIEGLIATSNLRHGQRTRPELIRTVVNAYDQVQSNLLLHDKQYPPAKELLSVIKAGQPIAGPRVPVAESIGKGKDTEGSDWIIEVVDRDDARPVWISIWGGSADLAQALWKVRATRKHEDLEKFISKLRVHAVYDQDLTGPWIKSEFPDLFYIFRHHGIRGMYRGGDTTLVSSAWVENNIRSNHGSLGNLYVNYRGGDIWGGQLGRVFGIKEGDTPSCLFLLENGLNDPGHPEWGNWAGRFQKESAERNLWVEAVDSVDNSESDPDPRMAAVYRWRPDWQADFAARLDWCVRDYAEANHAPKFEVNKNTSLNVRAGRKVELIAPEALDPDNDKILYNWSYYPEEGTYRGSYPVLKGRGKRASFRTPAVSGPQTIHILLKATDRGIPALSAYRRFIVRIEP